MALSILQILILSLFLSVIPSGSITLVYGKEIILAESDIGTLTLSDFKNWIKTKNLPEDILSDFKNSSRILDIMLEEAVLLEDAKERRVSQPPKTPSVIDEIKNSLIKVSPPAVTEREIQNYYNQHQQFFYRRPQRRLSHILVNNKEELRKLVRSFNFLLKKNINPQESMISLADDYSQKEPSPKRWGDLGWVSEDKFPGEFNQHVFSLKNNGDYSTFSTPLGYHFVMNMQIREPKIYALDEVRKYIKGLLQKQKREEFWAKHIERLKRKYNLKSYPVALEEISLDEEQKVNMVHIRGGEFYAGFDEKGIKERRRLWEKYTKPFVDQTKPGWSSYIYQTYHKANIKSFYIDKYEIRYSDYKKFLASTDHRRLPEWADEFIPGDDYPVVGVSWYDADAYCSWKKKRLPTQDEWEFAARGKTMRNYPWGNRLPDGKTGNFADITSDTPWRNTSYNDGYKYLAPVNSYPQGATPEGIYNLGGNVREWTASVNKAKEAAITKGGSFRNAFDDMLSADQRPYKLDTTDYTLGFRCACDEKIE